MKYADVVSFLKPKFESAGYEPLPKFDPGPSTDERVLKVSPGRILFIAVGDGRGFTTEQLYDQKFIRIRVVGPQNNFKQAEEFAYDTDKFLCSVVSNTLVGDALTLFINRTGGAPSLLLRDTSERYHFSCTYITETATGF